DSVRFMLSLWIASAAIRARLADPGGTFSGPSKVCKHMVCALSAESMLESPAGEVAPMFANERSDWTTLGDRPFAAEEMAPAFLGETAEGDDPFDDFDEDDFDDDFDDDFEE